MVALLGAILTFVRSQTVYGVKVTSVFYDFSIESSCDVFMRICLCFNVLFLRFCRDNGWGGGGGVMDLVYGSSSSFDMDCEVKIVCCYCRFAYIGFV